MPLLRPSLLPALLALAISACGSSTEPGDAGFRGVYARPKFSVGGKPWGIGIAANERGFALRYEGSTAIQFTVDAGPIGAAIPLGTDPIDVAFTASGSLAYFTMLNGTRVYEVDTETGVVLDSIPVGSKHHRILMHPDDSRFWVASLDGHLWTVDRASGAHLDSAYFPGQSFRGISRRAADGTLALSSDAGVLLLDNALDSITFANTGGWPQEVRHSLDGTKLYVAVESRPVVLILDAETLGMRDSIRMVPTMQPFGMALSPDGNTLVVSSAGFPFVSIADVPSRTVRNTFAPGGKPRRVAFSPDGKFAFIANEGGWVDVLK